MHVYVLCPKATVSNRTVRKRTVSNRTVRKRIVSNRTVRNLMCLIARCAIAMCPIVLCASEPLPRKLGPPDLTHPYLLHGASPDAGQGSPGSFFFDGRVDPSES